MAYRNDWHPRRKQAVITVTKREQRRLQTYLRRDRKNKLASHELAFDSDNFLYDLLEPMFTDDSFTWLPEGTTGDMTSAPILGILGDEMPGPATDKCNAQVCTTVAGGKSMANFVRFTSRSSSAGRSWTAP